MTDTPDPAAPSTSSLLLMFAAGTDVGCRREMNQDAWAYGPAGAGEVPPASISGRSAPIGLLQQGPSLAHAGRLCAPGWIAVADGMGGARGGEVASLRALQVIGAALAAGEVDPEFRYDNNTVAVALLSGWFIPLVAAGLVYLVLRLRAAQQGAPADGPASRARG